MGFRQATLDTGASSGRNHGEAAPGQQDESREAGACGAEEELLQKPAGEGDTTRVASFHDTDRHLGTNAKGLTFIPLHKSRTSILESTTAKTLEPSPRPLKAYTEFARRFQEEIYGDLKSIQSSASPSDFPAGTTTADPNGVGAMFKFMRQVGLALCVGMAVAVGLAARGYCVARFDAKSLLKGALAALEPAQPAKPAVEVAAVDEAIADSDAEPSQAKRRKRSPVLRPVVLEEATAVADPILEEDEVATPDRNEVPSSGPPQMASLPQLSSSLAAAATGQPIPAAVHPRLKRITSGGYTWLAADVREKMPLGSSGQAKFELDGFVGHVDLKLWLNDKILENTSSSLDLKLVDGWNVLSSEIGAERKVLASVMSGAQTALLIPKIHQVSNGRFKGWEPWTTSAVAAWNGYVRLQVAMGEGVNPQVLLFGSETIDGAPHKVFRTIVSKDVDVARIPGPGGLTELTVRVPQPTGSIPATSELVILTEKGSDSAITAVDNALKVTFTPIAEEKPTVTIVANPTIKVEYAGATYTNQRQVPLQITSEPQKTGELVLIRKGRTGEQTLSQFLEGKWEGVDKGVTVNIPDDDRFTMFARRYLGETVVATSRDVHLEARTTGPQVLEVLDDDVTRNREGSKITIRFDPEHPIWPDLAEKKESYSIQYQGSFDSAKPPAVSDAKLNRATNTVTLTVVNVVNPGSYTLTIKAWDGVQPTKDAGVGIADIASNKLNAQASAIGLDHKHPFEKLAVTEPPPSESRGVAGGRAPHIEFKEFEPRTEIGEGFNPSDKVVTRVARLYYFRDAHRVAQIVNRTAMSYNKTNVEMAQQWADRSLRKADEATDDRKRLEVKAVRAAQESRAAENALAQAQQALASVRSRQAATASEAEKSEDDLAGLNADEKLLTADVSALEKVNNDPATLTKRRGSWKLFAARSRRPNGPKHGSHKQRTPTWPKLDVWKALSTTCWARAQAKRSAEVLATEASEKAQLTEQRAREEQFRREVAAKTEDPDTFAPGNPKSNDPVAQVSVSVIGEGVIQLRGPLKGVNLIRTMINEIDSPVGQVRIALHTVQVNGEHGNRMEPVVAQMQRYIDHSRFLTNQSAQMLRNAVVKVASQKAQEAESLCPGGTQAHRDLKYQEAFFGADFIAELRNMDSEFLKTDNKVLSLHSMDTTSLSGALFLMALAKNDVRQQILMEFEALARGKLPQDEMEYLQASLTGSSKREMKRFLPLGHNATFKSLHGFFDAELHGTDTLSPLQREFIRLAQIFKSRLLAEIELKQRVTERALVEDRLGTRAEYDESIRKQRREVEDTDHFTAEND